MKTDKTAIHNKNPSPAIVWLYEQGYFKGKKSILDYGCGYGRNAEFLRSKGFDVFSFDPYHHVEKEPDGWNNVTNYIVSGFQLAFSSYVLNVVDKKLEDYILKTMKFLSHSQLHIVRNRDLLNLSPLKGKTSYNKILSLENGVETKKGLQRLVYLQPSKFENIRNVNPYKIYRSI